MSETHDDYFNLAQRIEDTFSEIDSDICTDLFHNDDKYAGLRQEATMLQQTHPAISNLLEGEGEICLSTDEHAALVQYLRLKFRIEEMVRQQIYFRGHMDNFAYLKKIGVI